MWKKKIDKFWKIIYKKSVDSTTYLQKFHLKIEALGTIYKNIFWSCSLVLIMTHPTFFFYILYIIYCMNEKYLYLSLNELFTYFLYDFEFHFKNFSRMAFWFFFLIFIFFGDEENPQPPTTIWMYVPNKLYYSIIARKPHIKKNC